MCRLHAPIDLPTLPLDARTIEQLRRLAAFSTNKQTWLGYAFGQEEAAKARRWIFKLFAQSYNDTPSVRARWAREA